MYNRPAQGPVSSGATISLEQEVTFYLCRTCVEEQNMRGQCQHFSDAERAISGTWVLDELRVALTKSYKVLEIHEVKPLL